MLKNFRVMKKKVKSFECVWWCMVGNPYFIFCWELVLRAYWMTASKWGFAGVWQVLYLNRTCVNQNFTHFIKHSMLSHKGVSQLWLSYVSTSFLLDLWPLFSCQTSILMIYIGWTLNQWDFKIRFMNFVWSY